MKKTILFILAIYCVTINTDAQFCNSKSGCYQKDSCFFLSQIYSQDYVYATVHNIYKSATASVDLYITIYSPCALPVNITDAKKIPSCKSCKRPFILIIHGGGMRSGCRKNLIDECEEFAKRGYVAATIDYRLGWVSGDEKAAMCNSNFCIEKKCVRATDDSCNPAYSDSSNFATYRALQDASAAMRFIVHYADSLNIDKNYLYLDGHSAGSIIATNLCYMNQSDLNNTLPSARNKLGTIDGSGNPFTDSFKIAGLFNNWGAVKDTAFIKGNKDKIPMIAFHGIDDSIVPFEKGYPIECTNGAYGYTCGSNAIYNKLVNSYADLPVELYCCYGGHGIFEDGPNSLYRIEKAICFFNRVCNGDKSRTYIRIDKDEKDITYQELDSTSPVNCNFAGLLNANFYTNNSAEKNMNVHDEKSGKFIIYPNPATSHATLHINKEASVIDIILTDINAKILWTKKIINAKDIDLPVQHLNAGLYFIIIKTEKDNRVLKLVKSN